MRIRETLEAEIAKAEGVLANLNPDNDYILMMDLTQAISYARQSLAANDLAQMRLNLEALRNYIGDRKP